MRAMILAAGYGTRLHPLTQNTPKPLLKVRGQPLIVHLIERLKTAGIGKIVVNVHYLANQIMSELGNGERFGVSIHYSLETELLDTGGGIYQALNLLGQAPFVVVSGDIYTDFNFATLPKKLSGLAHIVLTPNPSVNPVGDFALLDDRVCPEGREKFNYGGIAVLSPELFAHCRFGRFELAEGVLKTAIAKGQVSGELFTGKWHNVGTHAEFEALNSS